MGRAAACTSSLLLLGGLVAGCSDPSADEAEIDAWMDAQEQSVEEGLGRMSGRVDPDDPPAGPDTGITMTYESPVAVGGVRLSCFGDDTLTFLVEVAERTGAGTMTTGAEHEVACAEGAYTAEVGSSEIDAVRVDGFDADHHGAWHAVVLEE